jgi:TPR repeat protein
LAQGSFESLLLEAENGSIKAQKHLSYNYEKGVGVGVDLKKSAFWLWRAAEQGDAESQVLLGWNFQHGIGFEKNVNEAIKWYELAIVNGDPNGAANLGMIFFLGNGIEKNLTLARMWFVIADNNGREFEASIKSSIESMMTDEEIRRSNVWANACTNALKYENCN